jgi:hypothetical protein
MAKIRLLYLHRRHAHEFGREAFSGRLLYEGLRTKFDAVVTSHVVVDDETFKRLPREVREDAVSISQIRNAHINAIFLEGGMTQTSVKRIRSPNWKIESTTIAQFARHGGVVIASDLDAKFAIENDIEFMKLFKAWFEYGETSIDQPSPIYFVEPKIDGSQWKEIRLDSSAMKLRCNDWLSPVYNGFDGIVIEDPLMLNGVQCQAELAHIVNDTAGNMCDDMWWSPPQTSLHPYRLSYHPNSAQDRAVIGPFATVRQYGNGYLVAIAANVSSDRLIKKSTGNIDWIVNIFSELNSLAEVNKMTGQLSTFDNVCLFLSHSSVDKPIVESIMTRLLNLGVLSWLDKERILPSDSLELSIASGLDQCSHFVIFWSQSCLDASWIQYELQIAVAAMVERQIPLLIVKMDDESVPAPLSQFMTIDGRGNPQDTANLLFDAVRKLVIRTDRADVPNGNE